MSRFSTFSIYTVSLVLGFLFLSSCNGAKLSVADEQMARGEYFDASKTYRKIYNRLTKPEERSLRGEVALKMAECHRRLNQTARAESAYQNAIRYGAGDSTTVLRLAQMQQANAKYAAAIKNYEAFLEAKPGDLEAENGLAGSRLGLSKPSPTRYRVAQPKLFNSSRSDYAPMFFDKSYDRIYFTTTNEKATGTRKSEITGLKNGDIWTSAKNEKG
ncbi:MAG: hypothetical protein K2K84_07800, partial [Muribaculaceae bacterium]|nr:hypothetical protein [Muribaculaceae bacterium]